MPLYDYECLSCRHVFELRQSFDSRPEGTCPKCDSPSRRLFHAVPVIYKGSGFYTTDYKRAGVESTGSGTRSSPSSDKKKTESKTTGDTPSESTTKESSSTDGGSAAPKEKSGD